jgi:hypothetical protein
MDFKFSISYVILTVYLMKELRTTYFDSTVSTGKLIFFMLEEKSPCRFTQIEVNF